MTKQLKIITALAASLLVLSCSSASNTVKLASKEEAFLAQVEFLKESGEIVVVTSPTDQEVEELMQEKQNVLEAVCKTVTRMVSTDASSLSKQQEYLDQSCSPGATPSVDRDELSTRDLVQTRSCDFYEATRRIVCKEWQVQGDEISKEAWEAIKPNYYYYNF
jgi:23S rRNA A1618 N6-methylase RlmF